MHLRGTVAKTYFGIERVKPIYVLAYVFQLVLILSQLYLTSQHLYFSVAENISFLIWSRSVFFIDLILLYTLNVCIWVVDRGSIFDVWHDVPLGGRVSLVFNHLLKLSRDGSKLP